MGSKEKSFIVHFEVVSVAFIHLLFAVVVRQFASIGGMRCKASSMRLCARVTLSPLALTCVSVFQPHYHLLTFIYYSKPVFLTPPSQFERAPG